ncbi:hypothetical protein WJ92_30455 [Burkholderia ubonensis]|nr:hypothetical protein WJ92_30455 [Burkholderia ubonensis]
MRVAEVDTHVGRSGQVGMPSHLAPLIVGQRLAQWFDERLQLGREGGQRRRGCRSGILASSTVRLMRSTSTATDDLLSAPLMRSPSQWPGI